MEALTIEIIRVEMSVNTLICDRATVTENESTPSDQSESRIPHRCAANLSKLKGKGESQCGKAKYYYAI